MGKSEALKRVNVECVEEIVDAAMQHLPISLDLAVPENREKIRQWMLRICTAAMRQSAATICTAAENAISEAIELTIDSRYYEKKEQRRKDRFEKRKALKTQQVMSPAELKFSRLSSKERPQ